MEFNPGQYYQSHQKLSFIGDKGQQLLQQAKVIVIGTGGLGCPCLQYLAGCGVGTIGIADFDVIAVSNLHRQVFYNYADVGKKKTIIAVERLSAYNPGINFVANDCLVDETNVLSLLKEYDVVVDCTDNFQVRYLINDACVVLDKPLVYGAIHQTEGHVTVFNYKQSPTLRCLFPNENNDGILSCADIGAYNIITAIIGVMMANEIIKIILQESDVLAGRLCQFDSLTVSTRQIKYSAKPEGRKKSMEQFAQFKREMEISSATLQKKIDARESFYLVDVREPEEHQQFNIGGILMPLQDLLKKKSFVFSHNDTVILYCKMGGRSLTAAKYLSDQGFKNVFSLHSGINAWKRQ